MPHERIHAALARRSRSSVPPWVHRTAYRWFDVGAESVVVGGVFTVLSPSATLLTLAESFNDHRFERAAEDAWHLGLVSPVEAAHYLDQHRGSGHPGVARFERWLQKTGTRTRPSQSRFELDVIAALARVGLPEPQRQFPLKLASGEVVHLDIAWPDAMFALEPGHSWWHGGDLKMAADYQRDSACGEVGWLVTRLAESSRSDLGAVAVRARATYLRRRRLLRPQSGG